ncbi:MAG TPA: molybdenum cofactor guanylyltransferase [Verrucomicrobiae bacterium]|nr:molybdenum cofactor guanylyltransferase [Verrucomicrobiae bacterium]
MRGCTLTAMLLAGGQSCRMGMDKATIRLAGEPLWQRQLEILEHLSPSAVWISAKVAMPWFPPGIQVVFDAVNSRGPLGGIAAGLRRVKTSHLLTLAIDLPKMTTMHLSMLWAMARPGIGVIPRQDDYLEPLCAIYPAEASPLADKMLEAVDISVQHFGQQLQKRGQAIIYPLEPAEKPLYLNMNTPSEVPEFQRAGV